MWKQKLKGTQPRKHWRFWLSDREAIYGIVAVLLLIGLNNVFSASFIKGATDYDAFYYFLKKQLAHIVLGVVVCYLVKRLDYHRLRYLMPPITVALFAMLAAVLVIGPTINGAQRWLSLGPMTIQPSEFAKLAAILMESAYLSSMAAKGIPPTILHPTIVVVGAMGVLIEMEPDGATMAIVVGIPIFLMGLSTMAASDKFLLAGLVVLGVLGIFWLQPYRVERLVSAFDPWAHAEDTGYQVVQSMAAIGSGGLWGMGTGMGLSKYDYLPEAHTDFAFAIYCQEFGFLGALLVFVLYGALAFYGSRIANRATDTYGQFTAAGLTFLLVGQAVANMLMIVGFLPVIGVPLPFISYGGSSLLASMIAVGILANISIQSEKARPIRPPRPKSVGRPPLRVIRGGK